MRDRRLFITACALTLGWAAPAAAQQAPAHSELDSLTRVQVVRPRMVPRLIRGQLLAADSSALVLRTREGQVSVPMEGVQRVDVSRGRRIGVLRGTAQGFVGGVAMVGTLYLMGVAMQSRADDAEIGFDGAAVALAGPIIAGMTGVGAISGLLPGRERWRRTPLPLRVRPTPPPPPVPGEAPAP